jgi:hypothetical protein
LPEAPLGSPAGAQDLIEKPRGARAGLGHVDMRIGAVCDQAVGVAHHRAGHVGVQVEAGHDRHSRSDGFTNPSQNLAFAVVERLDHHRAMQVEVDAVHGHRLLQPGNQFGEDLLERGRGDLRGRAGRGPGGAGHRVARGAQRRDGAGGRDVCPFDRAEEGLAVLHAGPAAARFESRVVRLGGGEGVGLVLEAADCDARHAREFPL